jgi:predicted nucleotidyltransferase
MLDPVLQQIREIATRYPIQKVVLFGSRARGDHSPVSDYDIAINAETLTAFDRARFILDAEEIETLKKLDIVFIDGNLTNDLKENISREGVTIYE